MDPYYDVSVSQRIPNLPNLSVKFQDQILQHFVKIFVRCKQRVGCSSNFFFLLFSPIMTENFAKQHDKANIVVEYSGASQLILGKPYTVYLIRRGKLDIISSKNTLIPIYL